MIGSLRGYITERLVVNDRHVGVDAIIDVAGVGYQLTMTAATLSHLPVAEEVTLYVHHHIREADQKLFGFVSLADRSAFEGLLAAHGVGPSLALAVLSTYPASQLERILADDDLAALCEVPGVGKKTAQRLLVELRSTLVIPLDEDATDLVAIRGTAQTALGDVRDALLSLGYSSEEIRRAVADLPSEADGRDPHGSGSQGSDSQDAQTRDSGALLKLALRALAG